MMLSRRVRFIAAITLTWGIIGALLFGQVALAAQENGAEAEPSSSGTEEASVEDSIDLVSEYPVLNGESGETFEYTVVFDYETADEDEPQRLFNIDIEEPEGWQAKTTKQYGSTGQIIRAILLKPNMPYPDRLKVTLSPLPNTEPEPGDYICTIKARSGDLEGTIDLKAVVTEIPPSPELELVTTSGMLNTTAKSGSDSTFNLKLTSTGTGTVEDISFVSTKAEGWGITFSPNSIESMEPGNSEEIEATITPPERTIAGDYSVSLTARGSNNAYDKLNLRVSVRTPTTWGAAGIAIIAAVITGMVFLFRKLGRR
ncbi:MAG: NEW3 domain-containing protein [Dehalococcoidales bacterium]